MSCQSQTENNISHLSKIDQSGKTHSSSNQMSVALTERNTNEPLQQVTYISHTEKSPASSTKQLPDTNSLPLDFKNSHSSPNI